MMYTETLGLSMEIFKYMCVHVHISLNFGFFLGVFFGGKYLVQGGERITFSYFSTVKHGVLRFDGCLHVYLYDVRGVGLMRSCNAMQNKFGGKLPNSVLWKSAEYYSTESSLLLITGSQTYQYIIQKYLKLIHVSEEKSPLGWETGRRSELGGRKENLRLGYQGHSP